MNRTGQIIGSILLWGLVVVGYYAIRSAQSSPDAARAYFQFGSSMRPTACSGTGATGFQGTLTGVFYFDGQNVRGDVTKVDNGVTTQLHILSNDAQSFYAWVDETHGTIITRDKFNAQYDFSKIPLQCSVWWRPDTSYFDIPAFTPFSKA